MQYPNAKNMYNLNAQYALSENGLWIFLYMWMVKSGLADDLGTHTHVKTGKQHIMKIQRIVWSGFIVLSGFDIYMVHKNTTMG